ncbi:hypothetical protein ABZS76_18665 [Streptomyces sp. NPDC005562]|uniref:hypothetical protein n=1 Tax=unclassified Streptomyces TaxID=2593676 RepID=UPI0033BAB349
MTSARRLIAAVSLAAGAAALATPAAHAATPTQDTASPSVVGALDALGTSGMPQEQRAKVPTVESQLGGVQQLNQLHQLTDLVAPVTNALPAVQ